MWVENVSGWHVDEKQRNWGGDVQGRAVGQLFKVHLQAFLPFFLPVALFRKIATVWWVGVPCSAISSVAHWAPTDMESRVEFYLLSCVALHARPPAETKYWLLGSENKENLFEVLRLFCINLGAFLNIGWNDMYQRNCRVVDKSAKQHQNMSFQMDSINLFNQQHLQQ